MRSLQGPEALWRVPALTASWTARHATTVASRPYEAIVIGLGSHGSACLYNLAKWGSRVLGIERFGISHTFGSHHGHTRITRMAYMEGPAYVPLLRRSFQLYEELERETKQKLYTPTGVLNIGSHVFEGARATADAQQLPHEVLTAKQAMQRFPGLRLPDSMPVLYEQAGGILEPEKMVAAHIQVAQHHGAQVHTDEAVQGWTVLPDGLVEVATDKGTYRTEKLVLAAGAWMDQLVPELKGLCVPGRTTVVWMQPSKPELYHHTNFPVFILQAEPEVSSGSKIPSSTGFSSSSHDVRPVHGGASFYGFPSFGDKPGLKIGMFSVSEVCDPDNLDRQQREADLAPLHAAVQAYMPYAAGPVLKFAACMFIMTPDGHFVIDTHPKHEQVLLCSACSGHGFKLSPAVGLVLADMVRHGSCQQFESELQLHKLSRSRPGHDKVLDRFQA